MVPNHMGIDSRWVDGAPGLVHLAARAAVSVVLLHGSGPLDRRARVGSRSRTTTSTTATRPSSSSASDRAQRRDAVPLPRQRRHQHAVERHRAAGLPASRRARGRHPDDPRGRASLAGHPVRRGDDAREAAHRAALVPGAGPRRRHPVARGARHLQGRVRAPRCRSSSGGRSWTAWPRRCRTRSSSPRRSG